MSRGFFGSQFDHDHDGELNACDRAEEYAFFEMLHEDDDDSNVRSRPDDDEDRAED